MEMLAFLPLGFLIGMGHALEADHLAAVATMMEKKGSRSSLIARGAFWGLGHSLSLFIVCSAVVFLGLQITQRAEASLELAVGLMIVGLGAQTLWRLHRKRVHIHVHQHGGTKHLHAHSHQADPIPHVKSRHAHEHKSTQTNMKALAIGLMHGAAGSAGLLVLMVASTQNAVQALGYFAVFGLGSILGMAALSAVACYPLAMIHKGAAWLRNATTAAIGAVAIWVGAALAIESLTSLHIAGL